MTSRSRCTLALWALLLSGSPAAAAGQELGSILGGILGSVTDIDANYLWGRPTGSTGAINSASGLRGLGIEATLVIDSFIPLKKCPKTPVPGPLSTETARVTEVQIRPRPGNEGLDTVWVFSVQPQPLPPPCKPSQQLLNAELGIGYTQIRGVQGDSGLRGSIEEKPVLSLYLAATPPKPLEWFNPYVGARGGLTQLKDFRAANGDSSISGTGSTFEYGFVAGIAIAPDDNLAVFAEVAWTNRRFDGVVWSGGPKLGTLEAPFGISTRIFALGGQIRFVRRKDGS